MAEKIRKRSEIEAKYKWDLTHIFKTDELWEEAFSKAMTDVDAISAYDGHVAEKPKEAIRAVQEMYDRMMPVFEYAFLQKEADNTDPAAQARRD